jgi:hypothetical protein
MPLSANMPEFLPARFNVKRYSSIKISARWQCIISLASILAGLSFIRPGLCVDFPEMRGNTLDRAFKHFTSQVKNGSLG